MLENNPTEFLIEPDKTEKIAIEVIRVLWGRFQSFPDDASRNRNAPFHEAFLKAFADKLTQPVDFPYLISMGSWMHGLNTTLGQTFFENVSHILSDGSKREFSPSKSTQLYITRTQQQVISEIISDLKNTRKSPNVADEDETLLKAATEDSEEIEAQNFSADNFVEEDDYVEAIELKSVRPNAGELQGEKRKILIGKAALMRKYPDKKVRFYFGFPFDPWSRDDTGSDKGNFLRRIIEGTKYLDPHEVLLAGDLWDHLSGTPNTMRQILDLINRIATTDFISNYNFLVDPSNIDADRYQYLNLLSLWELHTERDLAENIDVLRNIIGRNKRLQRVLNNVVFNEGDYAWARAEKLSALLREYKPN
jgi:hypothetical protein